MPPQGLLAIAAYLPKSWEVRSIDENIRRAHETDLAWADAVLVSGMHVQPHPGRLFRELFHWVPFRHPQIDAEPTRAVLKALADFSG